MLRGGRDATEAPQPKPGPSKKTANKAHVTDIEAHVWKDDNHGYSLNEIPRSTDRHPMR